MKPLYSFKTLLLGGSLLLAGGAQAQLVGTDAFLKGRFVEVGITEHGSYGTSTSPTTYHSHNSLPVSGGPLGFVADPDMDGWTVGTPPYMGDYFYPGSPFEGWELQVGSARHQEFNMTTGTIGGNIAYGASGSKIYSTWDGIFDSVEVTQVTSIDTNSLYFTIHVTLTNLSVNPKDSLYYLRTLDPDNDQTWPGGSFTTVNKIDHQSRDTTVVSATGTSSSAPYLALGTADTNSTALVYGMWPIPATQDLSDMYNQVYTDGATLYTQGSTNTGDVAIGLVTYINHLATVDSALDSTFRTTSYYTRHPANSRSFTYFYAFSRAAKDSAVKNLHMLPAGTLGVKSLTAKEEIFVYPNPSKDMINVTGLAATDRVTLYDMIGREAGAYWQAHDGTNLFRYGSIPAGTYVLLVTGADGNVKFRTTVRKM